ncbi:hypothetical protein [Thermococcus pacificus]|uniref:Uncharacterized protein n=1 Tax=Thermococcus pacificus TaxID=71998 RepID=A0A218P6J7_9EURY|nr:hypothetical protein [Thermococcus pacificus]ASJ06404.1 hypothetical protein A3L08_03185 [Thermococcus pacificus]
MQYQGFQGGRAKPSAESVESFGFDELLYEILKEGLFWAALGRSSEVMPFLRGKLLENGVSLEKQRREYMEYLLDELEHFYRRVSWSGEISEAHWKALKSFHRELLALLY